MKNDGGPADEMTMRDYFAGQALVGLESNQLNDMDAAVSAKIAYELADALLAAREAPRPQEHPDV